MFIQRLCIVAVLSLTFLASRTGDEASAAVREKKEGIVAVHVNDRNGARVVSATGVVIDGRGIVATSCFVIPKWLERVQNTLVVVTESGTSLPIENLLSSNCSNNIALIQVRGSALTPVDLALDHLPEQGENITVVTMARGPVETEGRIKSVTRKTGFFQTSVPVTAARDGSPVLSRKGNVIGIATFLPARKQNQPAVIPARNIAKEFGKYKDKIPDLSLPPSPVPPSPPGPDKTDSGEADLASLTKKQREGKYDTAESAFLAGSSYDRSRRYKEAIEAYTRAIAMKRDYTDAYVGLGLVYYKLEKYPEAAEAYETAIRINPGIYPAYNKLGATYILLGEYAKALDVFKRSIPLDPANSEAHFNLGVAYVLTGDKDGAVDEYTVLKELDEKSAEKLLNLMY
jgi:Flp pilus assembly protein TadD